MRSLVALGSAAILVAVAAACSGGGHSSVPPPSGGAFMPAGGGAGGASSAGNATIRLKIPARYGNANSKTRRPKYISASTLAVTLAVYPENAAATPPGTVVLDVAPSATPIPGTTCSSNTDGSQNCSISVNAPVGSDIFVVKTYDQSPTSDTAFPSGANLLSNSGNVLFDVTLGGTNTLGLTLNGVVSNISVSPYGYLVPPTGSSQLALNVTASDPDNNIIVGGGTYIDSSGNPVTITLSSTSSAITFSTTSVTAPGTAVTATVDDGSLSGTATITASAGSHSSSLTTEVNNYITLAQTIGSGEPTPTATPAPATATPTPTPAPTSTATPLSQSNWALNTANLNFPPTPGNPGMSIPDGDTIWFTSTIMIPGPPITSLTTINMTNGRVFLDVAHGFISVPNFSVTFDPSATTSTISYSSSTGWSETVPASTPGHVLAGIVAFPLTADLSPNIRNASWGAVFTSNQAGPLTIHWQFSAAAYNSTFTTAFNSLGYSALGVKPIDSPNMSAYSNPDSAGTPENYKGDALMGGPAGYTGTLGPNFTVTLSTISRR
jgi:hypothetical protein